MNHFRLSAGSIDPEVEKHALESAAAGACVCFEGWVRNANEGRDVLRLDYQAFDALAESEGERILVESMTRFGLCGARAVHRTGKLEIGDLAVWVGASGVHRDAAFLACRWIIDEIKQHVPIWKNEHYADGESGWLHP